MNNFLIKFYARGSKPSEIELEQNTCVIALHWDKWDDFNYKTRFPCDFYINKIEVEGVPALKILIENVDFSSDYILNLVDSGWSGDFSEAQFKYISTPESIDFYSILKSKLGREQAVKIAIQLRDAGYLEHVMKDNLAIEMLALPGFSKSLLRETGSYKCYVDGWQLLHTGAQSTIGSFKFKPSHGFEVDFDFSSEIFPDDINLLVGPNGIGKTYLLKNFVEKYLGLGGDSKSKRTDYFEGTLNADRIILVSYSPFEDYAIDIDDSALQNKDAYHYFGFRKRADDNETIRISRSLPAIDSVESIFKSIDDDFRFGYIEGWVEKFSTINSIIAAALDFDFIALMLKDDTDIESLEVLYSAQLPDGHCFVRDKKNYIKLSKNIFEFYDKDKLLDSVDKSSGVIFFKDSESISPSSGQRLFSYIVINIIGSIKNNSLLIVDEPELFLHPNLEIEFLSLLKKILAAFSSKAILATHSLVAVREIPRTCVHVLRKTENNREIVHPPFETFGGDVKKISRYVFGDKSVSKPYEEWIKSMLLKYDGSENLIDILGKDVNLNLLLSIKQIESEIKNG